MWFEALIALAALAVGIASFVIAWLERREALRPAPIQKPPAAFTEPIAVDLHVTVLGNGGKGEIVIVNLGNLPAYNVVLDFPERSPLVENDARQKMPWPVLRPGESFRLMYRWFMGGARPWNAVLRWSEDDPEQKPELSTEEPELRDKKPASRALTLH